ncbi:protein YdfV, partial [Escherichia coli]
ESGHHLTGTDTIYFVTVRLHMHNSTYSSIFCFSMSVLLSRRRVSGDLTCR